MNEILSLALVAALFMVMKSVRANQLQSRLRPIRISTRQQNRRSR